MARQRANLLSAWRRYSGSRRPASKTLDATAIPKVLFIIGAPRSGSTLLDQVLGQVEGFFAVGELGSVWTAGLIEGERCGCGRTVRECPFWGDVFELLSRNGTQIDPAEIAALIDAHVRLRPKALVSMWVGARDGKPESPVRRYAELLEEIYSAVCSVSGARVLVDSTKAPAHAYALSLFTPVELYVVHLIRDPRALAYSWLRTPDAGDRAETGVDFRPFGVVGSTLQWVRRAVVAEVLLRRRFGERFFQLRYEDFSAAPYYWTKKLIEFLGEVSEPSVSPGGTIDAADNHILAGNRLKFKRGTMAVTPDAKWLDAIPARAKFISTALAWPLLPRYRYSILAAARRRTDDRAIGEPRCDE